MQHHVVRDLADNEHGRSRLGDCQWHPCLGGPTAVRHRVRSAFAVHRLLFGILVKGVAFVFLCPCILVQVENNAVRGSQIIVLFRSYGVRVATVFRRVAVPLWNSLLLGCQRPVQSVPRSAGTAVRLPLRGDIVCARSAVSTSYQASSSSAKWLQVG